jgi:hypothetical protein
MAVLAGQTSRTDLLMTVVKAEQLEMLSLLLLYHLVETHGLVLLHSS